MIDFTEHKISTKGVKSLAWVGDCLVDWACGGQRYHLDGTIVPRYVSYAYPFDAAIVSPSGEYAFMYCRTQTKGLMLRRGEIIREINRSFYHANAYEYPACFARLQDGREVFIHCPKNYCQPIIEIAATGEDITARGEEKMQDIFHSRLSISPGGKWLMSAGWLWHPVSVVKLYDLEACVKSPALLDTPGLEAPGYWEKESAAFVDDEKLFVGTSDEFLGDEDDDGDVQPGKHVLALWNIGSDKYAQVVSMGGPLGTLMSLGERHVVSFYGHPRVIDTKTGKVVHEWSHVDSGKQTNSITWDNLPPAIALDPGEARFAVAGDDSIFVVVFDPGAIGG